MNNALNWIKKLLLCCALVLTVPVSARQKPEFHILFDSLENKIIFLEKLSKYDQIDYFGSLQDDINRARAAGKIPQSLLSRIELAEGRNYFHKGEYRKAIPLLTAALEHSRTLKDSVDLLSQLNKAYVALNNLPKSFEIQTIVDKLRKQTSSEVDLRFAPRKSGLYYHFAMYREAIDQAKKELPEINNISTDFYFLANFNNDLGLYYYKLGNPDSAIWYFHKAQELLAKASVQEVQRKFFEGLIKGNIAQAIMRKGDYSEAIPLLKEDITNSIISRNIDNAAISHNELALCYLKLNRFDLARMHIDSAYAILENFEAPKILLQNRKLLIELYRKLGNTEESLKAYDFVIQLQDSVLNTEKSRNMINLQIMHELDTWEKENNRKQAIIEKEHLNNERLAQKQNIVLVILGASVILLAILILYILKTREKKQQLLLQYNKIAEQNQIIETSLNEKGLLLQEVHHRVKNNLQIISSLLKLQADKISNPDALEPLSQSKRRIESMALIHQMLYKRSSFNEIDLDTYVRNLLSRIDHSFSDPDKKVNITLESEPMKLHIDKAIPLGLVITEIITNSYKYGFKDTKEGHISVQLMKNSNKICFKARDNGIGLPVDVESKKENSLGLELIEILCGQLDAELKIESRDGVSYEIIFS